MSPDLGKAVGVAVVTAVVGLLVTESYQSTPWLADKFMRWSVRLRYPDNPERATVRGEELISLLADLPTLLKLPTAAGFLLRALAHRAVPRPKHVNREPHAVRGSRGRQFRIDLVKKIVAILCTGTALGIEFAIARIPVDSLVLGAPWLGVGIAAAGMVAAAWPSRFRLTLTNGISFTLSLFVILLLFVVILLLFGGSPGVDIAAALLSGAALGATVAPMGAHIEKSRYVGFTIGVLTNLMGVLLLAMSPDPLWLFGALIGSNGLGIAVGAFPRYTVGDRAYRGKAPRRTGMQSSAVVQE